MTRKMMVLVTTVSIVAAFALPASASANWKHHDQEIAETAELDLTGSIKYETGNGSTQCHIGAKLQLSPGQTTGTVLTWGPTSITTNCKTSGFYVACQIHSQTPEAPFWTLHTSGETIRITTETVIQTMTGGFCPTKQIMFTPSTITLTSDQPNTFSKFTLSGQLETHKDHNGSSSTGTATIIGSLDVLEPNANTYSL